MPPIPGLPRFRRRPRASSPFTALKPGTEPAPGQELCGILDRLYRAYGNQHWWPGDSALEVVVGAVLTQNTAWANVEHAIARLKRRGLLDLERLAVMTPSRLAPIIRPVGFFRLKARRLLSVLRWLRSRSGFPGVLGMPTETLRHELLACNGVGPETADSILLYALTRPVFVVDAYTKRILFRYGLLQGDESYSAIQSWFHRCLGPNVPMYNEFHALFVRLAKEHCRARALCQGCPLS